MKTLYLLAILTLLFASCNKVNKGASIEIGNTKKMHETEHDLYVVSSGFGNMDEARLDLDGDGTDDILFRSIISGSPNLGQFNGYSIEALHAGCGIATTLYADTTWIAYDTTYLNNPQTNDVHVIMQTNLACTQLDPTFTINTTNSDAVRTRLLTSGESLHLEDTYNDEVVELLAPEDHTGPLNTLYTSNDTTYQEALSTYNEACRAATNDASGYLGIRLETSDGPKLGWIEFTLTNGYTIHVKRSAIQR